MFFLLNTAHAKDVQPVRVLFDEYIQKLRQDYEKSQKQECLETSKRPLDLGYTSDPVLRTETPSPRYCETLSEESFCRDVEEACKHSAPEASCYVQGQTAAVRRRESIELRQRVYIDAASVFYKSLNDKKKIDRCCKGNALCAESIPKTKLFILKGMPENLFHGEFLAGTDLSSQRIEVSEEAFLYCHTKGCITQMIDHELGHACAHALGVRFKTCIDQPEQRKALFEKVFSPAVTECIVGSIEEKIAEYHTQDPTRAACPNARYNELFADAVSFDSFYGDLSRYRLMCDQNIEDWHGPSRGFFACLLKDKKSREPYCKIEGRQ